MSRSPLYEEDVYSDYNPAKRETRLLGIHGVAHAGKDSVGSVLIEDHGYQRISFAAPLKRLALRINPVIRWDNYGNTWTLKEVVDDLGWEEAKNVGLTRQFLQDLGDGVREVVGKKTWVDIAMRKVQPGGKYVFTDVRYPNEGEAVHNHPQGTVVEVVRPGVGPVNGHISEKRLPENLIDVIIENDGTLDDLHDRVKYAAKVLSW